MTAVFPSSTSITCCTSNLKSWRSVERRGVPVGPRWRRHAMFQGGLCLGVFSHNKQLKYLTMGALCESFLHLLLSRGV